MSWTHLCEIPVFDTLLWWISPLTLARLQLVSIKFYHLIKDPGLIKQYNKRHYLLIFHIEQKNVSNIFFEIGRYIYFDMYEFYLKKIGKKDNIVRIYIFLCGVCSAGQTEIATQLIHKYKQYFIENAHNLCQCRYIMSICLTNKHYELAKLLFETQICCKFDNPMYIRDLGLTTFCYCNQCKNRPITRDTFIIY